MTYNSPIKYGNKCVTGLKIKATGELKLNDSPVYMYLVNTLKRHLENATMQLHTSRLLTIYNRIDNE